MQWLMKAMAGTGRNKRRYAFELVVDGTCGGREASIGNDGCKSVTQSRQRDLHLHGKADDDREDSSSMDSV
jgi:hypothetical protein